MGNLFQFVRLRGRRLHLLLLDGRIVGAADGKAHPDAMVIDRLDITDGDERLDGSTLYVGAFGLMRLADHLYQRPSLRTPRALGSRLARLFSGAMLWSEMLGGTVRAGLGLRHVGGDTSLWLAAAQRQLSWSGAGPVRIRQRWH